jgi:integrase/recombinase XerD
MFSLNGFEYHLLEKGKSEKTIKAYLVDVTQFFNYLEENNIIELHNSVIKDYMEYLLYQKFQVPTTVNRKLVAIHKWCLFKEIPIEPVKVKVQTQNFLDNVIDKKSIDRMVEIAEKKKDLRAIALFKTLQLTGMRVSECLSLTIKDIYKDTIQITGKGNKIRMVFIPKALKVVWLNYCKNGRKYTQTDWLFVGKRGKTGRVGADYIVKKYAKLAEVDLESAHCHSFRHHFCKNLSDKNVPIEAIADLAGHSSIETARIYTRKSKSELLSIIEDLD